MQITGQVKVCGSAIKSVSLTRAGDRLLVNCADRVIRILDVREGKQLGEFQDPVNRTQWKTCCFSTDGDYMIAGSVQKAQHDIYIWNTAFGQLQKILVGPKEGFMDLVVCACARRGFLPLCHTLCLYFSLVISIACYLPIAIIDMCFAVASAAAHHRVGVGAWGGVRVDHQLHVLSELERVRTRLHRARGEHRVHREGGGV